MLIRFVFMALLGSAMTAFSAVQDQPWLEFTGKTGLPGSGTRVVLISGDEEYRSEESMPMLAKILSVRHGFDCTVLFAIDPATGVINPNNQTNIPGLEALAKADVMIIATRYRQLPPEQSRWVYEYVKAGKPVIGLRTATHAFTGDAETDGLKWKDFGLVVLGETWVNHHGKHKVEGARGVIEPANAATSGAAGGEGCFRSVGCLWRHAPQSRGEDPVAGSGHASLDPKSPAVEGEKNTPMMPLAWFREYQIPNGKKGRAFCSTMGAAVDFVSEDLRRLIVNATFTNSRARTCRRRQMWRSSIPSRPRFMGFCRWKRGRNGRSSRPISAWAKPRSLSTRWWCQQDMNFEPASRNERS